MGFAPCLQKILPYHNCLWAQAFEIVGMAEIAVQLRAGLAACQ